MEALPKLVDDRIKERANLRSKISSQVNDAIANHIPSQVDSLVRRCLSGHILHVHPVATTPCRPFVVHPKDQDDPHDDAHLEGENSVKRQKIFKHGTFEIGGSSFGQDYEGEPGPSTSAKLHKVVDEMLRKQCTSGDEHQYHNDQMQNFLKSDIVWESRKEIIVPPYQPKPTPVVQSCQRDPKASGLPLVNQDLLYLKKGNSGPDKIVLSLYKFPAVIFLDDDIEERTSIWVKKCVKRFNPYARYGVEHCNNPHAKIFYIKNQKAPGKPKEEIYLNSKIVQIIMTYWELDYKNLNKNDIEDMYLLIINHKVDDYAETGLLLSLSVFIRSIEKYKMFSIISEPVYGIIYENNKKEKRVMRHQEVHKFCDATLKRVLEGLKSYNNNLKYGYVTHNLSLEFGRYGVSSDLDTTYREFLGVGTMHRYDISSLMDTAYRMSEQ
ncbi:hypothetical protein Tco_0209232 [Tanacetum coccineum]